MPNKTLYLNTITNLETLVGGPINKEDVEKRLQEAWNKDKSDAKVDFLEEYRNLFREVLRTWGDNEIGDAYRARVERQPNLKKCLLQTDQALKTCAMALIPALRDKEDVLSHMTFGAINSPDKIVIEFTAVRAKHLTNVAAEKAATKRRADAYEKYKNEWKDKSIRHITSRIQFEKYIKELPKEDKIDFALALDSYRKDPTLNPKLTQDQQVLIDDALDAWKKELGCDKSLPLDEYVASMYSLRNEKLAENEWVQKDVNDAVEEYNNTPNPAKNEIARYKVAEENTKEIAKIKESNVVNHGVTDEAAEMVGDLFMREELAYDAVEGSYRREVYLDGKIDEFNQKYSLRISKEKMRYSVNEVSKLMVQARLEKEPFLSNDNVVVIEKGVETCYSAKEYFAEYEKQIRKEHEDRLAEIEKKRSEAKQEYDNKKALFEKNKNELSEIAWKKLVEDLDEQYKTATAGFDLELSQAKMLLEEGLETTKGGVVIEKDGNSIKTHKSSRYYETHETSKERYAYNEYQEIYARFFKDACKVEKERCYAEGKVVDLSKVAKDVDNLLKTSMYELNIYDNEKNKEILQRTNFGGFSAERLSEFVMEIEGDMWVGNQSTEKAWAIQKTGAKKIIDRWKEEEKTNPKEDMGDKIKRELAEKRSAYRQGKISKKEVLDHMIATDAYLQKNFPSLMSKLFSFQHSRIQTALDQCCTLLNMKVSDSLRVAMNTEYAEMAKKMGKENVFKSMEKSINSSLGEKKEKEVFDKEHKAIKDKVKAEKQAELNELKKLDREPISIKSLDERKLILFQEPRVKPIKPPVQLQQSLSKQQ